MESDHERFIREHYASEVENTPIFRLDVANESHYTKKAFNALIRKKMAPVLALLEKFDLLQKDIKYIRGILANMDADGRYNLAADIRERMKARGLSANALAKRCWRFHPPGGQPKTLSTPAIGKWLKGAAHPNGKEQMKELGMALGMNEEELSDFLLKNKYTPLHIKNPFDVVAKRILRQHAADKKADLVRLYHAELDQRNITSLSLLVNRVSIVTTFLSASLKGITSEKDFDLWFEKYASSFDADGKTVLPTSTLRSFILFHIGYRSVRDMYEGDELPELLYRLLPRIRDGMNDPLRGLREKLIALGLYSNMTDADIDLMLGHARLMPLAKSPGKIDAVIVALLRRAHERCPCCEYMAIDQVIKNIVSAQANRELRDQRLLKGSEELLVAFRHRQDSLKNPFVMLQNKDEKRFEDYYSDHLSIYIRDMLRLLACYGSLAESEVAPYVELISNAKEHTGWWRQKFSELAGEEDDSN
ncbi:MAG TPA: hypothetical protein DEB25_00120 [Desulfobulbaceae bacterium]|nr:hypothetical protein [Desulfobulbaceae bacterium]